MTKSQKIKEMGKAIKSLTEAVELLNRNSVNLVKINDITKSVELSINRILNEFENGEEW